MKCPACREENLVQRPTTAGVVVDHCGDCSGIWLDEGEIFLFSRDPSRLDTELGVPDLAEKTPTDRLCPRDHAQMEEGSFFEPDLRIDQCPECLGLWFDHEKLGRAVDEDPRSFRLRLDPTGLLASVPRVHAEKTDGRRPTDQTKRTSQSPSLASLAHRTPLPNLFLRSAGVLAFLYGILGLALIALVVFAGFAPGFVVFLGVVIAGTQFLFGPLIMDWTLQWLYRCRWVSPDRLPSHLRDFVHRVAKEQGMKFPRFGLIPDGAPNAFTYGHTPNNARIVITQGILDLLDEEEVEAVVAHEIGHAKHWDMLLMTIAALVPLILYYLYVTLMHLSSVLSEGEKDSSNDQGGGIGGALFLGAVGGFCTLYRV